MVSSSPPNAAPWDATGQMSRHSIHLGAAWEPGDASAGATWIRRFGRPGGLGPRDRVLLVWERTADAPAWRRLVLNGHDLGPWGDGGSRFESDVTALLTRRNELVLELPALAASVVGGFGLGRASLPVEWGRIALEIVASD